MQHQAIYLYRDFISYLLLEKKLDTNWKPALLSSAPFSLYLLSSRKKNDAFIEGRSFIAFDILATP
jgi:hypothetical protein